MAQDTKTPLFLEKEEDVGYIGNDSTSVTLMQAALGAAGCVHV